jgi:uncharacterized protein YcnI
MTMIACVAALALPATASAHVFIEQSETAADGFPILDFVVPHGCDGSPTTQVTVQIPKSVPSVTPERHPLWELSTKEGPKDEAVVFDETITKGISEVTWTATKPLPDDELERLGLELKAPNTPGETVYFPTIQKCEQGETRWIEIPAEGQSEEDLESPAPALTLTEAEGGHGSSGEESEGEEHAEEKDDDDGAPMWMGIAGLVVGASGLLAGGAALRRSKA